ncbi:hypothetical protein ACI1US_00604 [Leucobacter sp. BZR 635]
MHCVGEQRGEPGQYGLRTDHVVGGDAGLAGVHEFAPGEPLRDLGERHRLVDVGGRFPAELKRHGREVVSGRVRDDAPDLAIARVEDVVEALGEQRRGLGDCPLDDGNGPHIEGVGDHLRDELRGGRRKLTRLDHHSVTGGDRPDDGRQREHERIVPRRDHERHAQCLRDDLCARRLECERHADPARPHPLREVLQRVIKLGYKEADLSELCLGARLAEVVGQGALKVAPAIDQEGAQPRQLVAPPLLRSRDSLVKGVAQPSYDSRNTFNSSETHAPRLAWAHGFRGVIGALR